eukprot:749351-Hanusia_phi.AAC.6
MERDGLSGGRGFARGERATGRAGGRGVAVPNHCTQFYGIRKDKAARQPSPRAHGISKAAVGPSPVHRAMLCSFRCG